MLSFYLTRKATFEIYLKKYQTMPKVIFNLNIHLLSRPSLLSLKIYVWNTKQKLLQTIFYRLLETLSFVLQYQSELSYVIPPLSGHIHIQSVNILRNHVGRGVL